MPKLDTTKKRPNRYHKWGLASGDLWKGDYRKECERCTTIAEVSVRGGAKGGILIRYRIKKGAALTPEMPPCAG